MANIQDPDQKSPGNSESLFSALTNTSTGRISTRTAWSDQENENTSEYGIQLREKQKVKYTYGSLSASSVTPSRKPLRLPVSPALCMLQMLESRLDIVVYRLGVEPSRPAARQAGVTQAYNGQRQRLNIPLTYCARAYHRGTREI